MKSFNPFRPESAVGKRYAAAAKAPEAARALLKYLSSPEVAGIYKSLGMEPGR